MGKEKTIGLTIKNYYKNHRKTGLFPLESTSTIPVPVSVPFKGKIFFIIFYYIGKRLEADEKIKIYHPCLELIFAHPNAKIIYYRNLIYINSHKKNKWEEPIGEFPHEQIESMNLKEYRESKNELYSKYDKVIDLMQNKKNDNSFKSEFRDLFYKLCEPCMLPYLKDRGKKFFLWLDGD